MAKGSRPRHPDKDIKAAIRYAESKGWTCLKAQGHAHCWGLLRCHQADRSGCQFSILSTPKRPFEHARWLCKQVDRCQHAGSSDPPATGDTP